VPVGLLLGEGEEEESSEEDEDDDKYANAEQVFVLLISLNYCIFLTISKSMIIIYTETTVLYERV